VYPEYLTDINIVYCPSDPIGVQSLKDGWMNVGEDPNGQFDHCRIGFHGRYGEYWDLSGASGEYGRGHTPTNYSYEYFGWALTTENVVGWGANWDVYWQWAQAGAGPQNDIGGPDPSYVDQDIDGGGGTVYRLKEGIERFFITDINNPAGSSIGQSELAAMWDACQFRAGTPGGVTIAFNHVPGGANVLYMDGHVEFMRYLGWDQGEFPVHTAYMERGPW
jgi:prepilin-type processing-associated H-X9-DG protein